MLVTLSALLIFTGCSTIYYVPDPTTFKFDETPDFSSSQNISLVNIQESSENLLLFNNHGHKFYGNLQQWTDVAIAITNRELSKRGMSVAENSSKTLEMSIISVRPRKASWHFRTNVELKVVAGNGYTSNYISEGPSPLLNRSFDAAVIRSVAAMLKDDNIIKYLTQ